MGNASRSKDTRREAPKRRKGAKRADFSWRDHVDGWVAHHRESSRDALRRLWQHRIGTLVTLLALAVALALPAGLSLVVKNIKAVTGAWEGQAHISVFLQQDTNVKAQRALAGQWRDWDEVERVKVITPDQALAEFQRRSDSGAILAALPDNPLPPVLVVYPKVQQADQVHALKQRLQQASQVDKVILDMAWVKKLQAFIQLAQRLVSVLTLALGAGIILLINNTLQLAIENRRDEIVVMKTVGGTDGFVRRPFLYTGFWYGFGGGVFALILVAIAFVFVGQPAQELLMLYGGAGELHGLSLSTLLLLPIMAGLLGLLGAFLAVSRHIHDIEPRQF